MYTLLPFVQAAWLVATVTSTSIITQSINITDKTITDNHGIDLTKSGDVLIVGFSDINFNGGIEIYKNEQNIWINTDTIKIENAGMLGHAVTIDDNGTTIISASIEYEAEKMTVYMFKITETGTWDLTNTTHINEVPDEYSVKLSGDATKLAVVLNNKIIICDIVENNIQQTHTFNLFEPGFNRNAVDLSYDGNIIGIADNNNCVYSTYLYNGSHWDQIYTHSLLGFDSNGETVSVIECNIAVTVSNTGHIIAYSNSIENEYNGRVYTLFFSDTFTEHTTKKLPTYADSGNYGNTVKLSSTGEFLAIGSFLDNTNIPRILTLLPDSTNYTETSGLSIKGATILISDDVSTVVSFLAASEDSFLNIGITCELIETEFTECTTTSSSSSSTSTDATDTDIGSGSLSGSDNTEDNYGSGSLSGSDNTEDNYGSGSSSENTNPPTEPPATSSPTEPQATNSPTEPPATSSPTEPPATSSPTEPPATNSPTDSPTHAECPTEYCLFTDDNGPHLCVNNDGICIQATNVEGNLRCSPNFNFCDEINAPTNNPSSEPPTESPTEQPNTNSPTSSPTSCSIEPDSNGHVDIPNSVTSIDNNAFNGCTTLESVTIPNTVTVIGVSAFSNTALTSVNIPNSVNSIQNSAFKNCYNLKTVALSNTLTSVGSGCFQSTAITSITIPSSITKIASLMFSNNTDLVNITLSSGLTEIGANSFRLCTALEEIVIPETVGIIGVEAFRDCSALKTISYPENCSIQSNAFTNTACSETLTSNNNVENCTIITPSPTNLPTEAPATNSPTELLTTDSPTEEPATNSPTESLDTNPPTEAPDTNSPTEPLDTNPPTEPPATNSPTESLDTNPPTEPPTNLQATNSPTELLTTDLPTEPPVLPTRIPSVKTKLDIGYSINRDDTTDINEFANELVMKHAQKASEFVKAEISPFIQLVMSHEVQFTASDFARRRALQATTFSVTSTIEGVNYTEMSNAPFLETTSCGGDVLCLRLKNIYTSCLNSRFDLLKNSAEFNNIPNGTGTGGEKLHIINNNAHVSQLKVCDTTTNQPFQSSSNFLGDWKHINIHCFGETDKHTQCQTFDNSILSFLNDVFNDDAVKTLFSDPIEVNNHTYIVTSPLVVSTETTATLPPDTTTTSSDNKITIIYATVGAVGGVILIGGSMFFIKQQRRSSSYDSLNSFF